MNPFKKSIVQFMVVQFFDILMDSITRENFIKIKNKIYQGGVKITEDYIPGKFDDMLWKVVAGKFLKEGILDDGHERQLIEWMRNYVETIEDSFFRSILTKLIDKIEEVAIDDSPVLELPESIEEPVS